MFDSLSSSLSSALNSIRGRGKLTESNMRDGLGLVRTALLEADVAYDVVEAFLQRVTAEAVGEKVLASLDPAQQLVGIVHQELVNLMGPVDHTIHYQQGRPTVLMLCGLQGSGKTTSTAKLAKKIKQQGRSVMLVAADLQRPAAIEQLSVLGRQLDVPVHTPDGVSDPVAVCNAGVARAKKEGIAVVILDTAGRLSIDDALMAELAKIDRTVAPDQVFLVVDGMTGQDAVASAKAFNDALELDGVIMTKLDGDARGGAALSVKHVTGVPSSSSALVSRSRPWKTSTLIGSLAASWGWATWFRWLKRRSGSSTRTRCGSRRSASAPASSPSKTSKRCSCRPVGLGRWARCSG